MQEVHHPSEQKEVHDPSILASARQLLDACRTPQEMQEAVLAAVARDQEWRGKQCLNLIAPESLASPTVRGLLADEVGSRASVGNIGSVNRWFAGARYIDEIEALCVELLKKVFRARYADYRLIASTVGIMAVYTALTEPGDVIMSLTQPFGGHSSHRSDGPAGVRGLKIVDIPFDPVELEVDIDLFRKVAPLVRPKLVSLGATMTLFPFPLQAMHDTVAEWEGTIYCDGAHQLGLIAGGQFQDPLREGAAVMTGSAGKTFSGPLSGIVVWNDPQLTDRITHAIFPVLAGSHQVNRVAALAVSAAENLAFGPVYMAQIVRNAQTLGAALAKRGIPMLGAHKGYTATHQVVADVRQFGGGSHVSQLLERANIITNKNLIPADTEQDRHHPGGIRIGTIEITRLGMYEKEMETVADFIARVLVERVAPEEVRNEVIAFREAHQTLYYCFENGLPG